LRLPSAQPPGCRWPNLTLAQCPASISATWTRTWARMSSCMPAASLRCRHQCGSLATRAGLPSWCAEGRFLAASPAISPPPPPPHRRHHCERNARVPRRQCRDCRDRRHFSPPLLRHYRRRVVAARPPLAHLVAAPSRPRAGVFRHACGRGGRGGNARRAPRPAACQGRAREKQGQERGAGGQLCSSLSCRSC